MKQMRRVSILAFALVFAVAAVAQEKKVDPKNGGAPKLVLASPTHDFGEVKSGTPLKYTFVFKNKGNADLHIKSVQPG